ncbi:MAG: ABC transporter permease subunit [Verrucomicrobiales bacterium]|nr:ABC transporter permease subunit [Verrucomicrobiales bacterium]
MSQTTPSAFEPATKTVSPLSLRRVMVIASSSVTQLVRMKTFYFLLAFAAIIVVLMSLNPPTTPAGVLSTIKRISFGTMDVFAWLFAIVSTALLIPKDIEDRTLYTILSKPVRRIEYLIGKLLGVLWVIAVSLLVMYGVCALALWSRETLYIAEELEAMNADARYSAENVGAQIALIEQQGLRPELGIAVLASFLKAAVVASVTIFLSTFASSSLFSIIISVLVFIIGHAHTMATSFWLYQTDNSLFVQLLLKVVKIFIPNFQLYSFSHGIIQGEAVAYSLVWQMTGLTGVYLVVFLFLSLLVFIDKEF